MTLHFYLMWKDYVQALCSIIRIFRNFTKLQIPWDYIGLVVTRGVSEKWCEKAH